MKGLPCAAAGRKCWSRRIRTALSNLPGLEIYIIHFMHPTIHERKVLLKLVFFMKNIDQTMSSRIICLLFEKKGIPPPPSVTYVIHEWPLMTV